MHRAIAKSSAAYASSIVVVVSVARSHHLLMAPFVDKHSRIAFVVRTESRPQHSCPLVAQIVLAIVEGRVPFAPFQQNHAETGGRQFFRGNAAAGACAYHDCINVFVCHLSSRRLTKAVRGASVFWRRSATDRESADRESPASSSLCLRDSRHVEDRRRTPAWFVPAEGRKIPSTKSVSTLRLEPDPAPCA